MLMRTSTSSVDEREAGSGTSRPAALPTGAESCDWARSYLAYQLLRAEDGPCSGCSVMMQPPFLPLTLTGKLVSKLQPVRGSPTAAPFVARELLLIGPECCWPKDAL